MDGLLYTVIEPVFEREEDEILYKNVMRLRELLALPKDFWFRRSHKSQTVQLILRVQSELDKLAIRLEKGIQKSNTMTIDAETLRICFRKSPKMTEEQKQQMDIDMIDALETLKKMKILLLC